MPEPSIPFTQMETEIMEKISEVWDGPTSNSDSYVIVAAWADMVDEAFKMLEKSALLVRKSEMRQQLVEEVINNPSFDLKSKLKELNELIPASIERNIAISNLLENEIEENKWISGDILEECVPARETYISEVATTLLRSAITFYPGGLNKLVLMLNGDMHLDTVVDEIVPKENISDRKKVYKAFKTLLNVFSALG